MRAESFPLDRAGHLPATRSPMAGRLTANLDVGGRPDAPELSLTAEAKAPAWGDYRVDGASARARYAGDRLEVPELHMSRGGVTSSASGEMPIVLALGRKPELPDRPMSWRVDLPNGDLSLLPLFVPQIGFASGRFDLQATVAGTSRHPQIIGGVRVRDGKVRLAGREEFLDAVYADLTIQRSRLTLDTLSARQDNRRGEPGRLWGKGEVRLDGLAMRDYGFELRLRDFTAQEPFQYAALIDGDFTVAPGAKVRGQVLPHVEGQVEVRQAYVLFDFANQSEVQQIASTTQPLYWTYRLHLSATDNLSWRPPNADIEFSADLDLAQSPDSLVIYGDVRAIRGSYYFLSNRFTVQSAELTFDNVGGVNPQILAVAETEVPRASSGPLETSANSGRERITVTIRNRVREPQIEFASDSGWGEAEILRAITVGQFEDVRGGLALANPLDSYVTQAISRQLDAEMSRLFQGRVEQWEVRRESGGGVLVGASTQLGPIRVRYHQRIAGLDRAQSALGDAGVERDIEAEYRLNRFFVVTSEVTQRRTLTGGVTTVSGTPDFNVNLKARWEY
jgi:hypothetical protein